MRFILLTHRSTLFPGLPSLLSVCVSVYALQSECQVECVLFGMSAFFKMRSFLENVLCECVYEVCDHTHYLRTDYSGSPLYRLSHMKPQSFRFVSPFYGEPWLHFSKRSTAAECVMPRLRASLRRWDYAVCIPIWVCPAPEKQCEKARAYHQFGKQPPN